MEPTTMEKSILRTLLYLIAVTSSALFVVSFFLRRGKPPYSVSDVAIGIEDGTNLLAFVLCLGFLAITTKESK